MEKLEILKNKKSSELTADDIFFLKNKEIINGCGARVIRDENYENFLRNIFTKISQILVKTIRPVFFEASCDLHDFGYWKGGDEARRKECDEKFLQKILEDIETKYLRIWNENGYLFYRSNPIRYRFEQIKNFFERIFYTILAKLFYLAVRIGGKKYFNYH